MKKHLSLFLLLFLMLTCVIGLAACDAATEPTQPATDAPTTAPATEPATDAPKKSFSVTLRIEPGSRLTASGLTTKMAEEGGSVSFSIKANEGYTLVCSAGEYDEENGVLTVANVTENTEITVYTIINSGWNVRLTGSGFSADKTTKAAKNGESVTFTLKADPYCYITDVSRGSYDPATGTLTVENVTGSLTISVSVRRARINYHYNDGTANLLSVEPDFTFYACPNTRWDDGTISRAGYALVEYNTKADGTGEAYSLGSKVWYDPAVSELDLYCIWMPETSRNDFTFVSGGAGYTVTAYTGDDETVVIPTVYNGRPVTGIAAGAFNGRRVETLVMPRTLQTMEAGAFVGCASLATVYFPDSLRSAPDTAFDAETYGNLTHFYLNATVAPRLTYTYDGMYRVKWDHVMASKAQGHKVIVVVGGSSAVYGFSAQYMEKLMSGAYDVINFGTICTTAGRLYVEALASLLTEDDILIWAPESSTAYQMGSGVLDTFKIFRDTEGMYNVWRAVDISRFSHYFSGLTDFYAQRGNAAAKDYEGYNVNRNPSLAHEFRCTYPDTYTIINYWGDLIGGTNKNKSNSQTPGNKVSFDGKTTSEACYGSTVSGTDIAEYADVAKEALQALRDKGVKVYFGFAPTSEKALIGQAALPSQQKAYDALIARLYGVEVLGSCSDHVFAYTYMTNGDAHHLTDKGTQIHTYRLYKELCTALGLTAKTEAEAKTVGASVPGIAW